MKIRQYEIAKKLGLSPMTVSRVLRGHSNVSDGTRAQIIEMAQEMGAAHLFATRHKNKDLPLRNLINCLLLIPTFENPQKFQEYYGNQALLKGLKSRLAPHQSEIVLKRFSRLEEIERMIEDARYQGLILRGHYPPQWTMKVAQRIPVVNTIASHGYLGVDSVGHHESLACWTITEYLQQLGHQTIVWFGIIDTHTKNSIPTEMSLQSRLIERYGHHGYRYASWQEMSLFTDPHFHSKTILVERDHEKQSLSEIIANGLEQILALKPKPTAIVAASDFMAFELLHQLQEKEIKVPQQMSVIGYGNPVYSDHADLGLTCIDLNYNEIGKMIPEILERRKANMNGSISQTLVECPLVIGQTACAVKNGS